MLTPVKLVVLVAPVLLTVLRPVLIVITLVLTAKSKLLSVVKLVVFVAPVLLTVVIFVALVAPVLLTVLRPVLIVVTLVLTAESKLLSVVKFVVFVAPVLLTVLRLVLIVVTLVLTAERRLLTETMAEERLTIEPLLIVPANNVPTVRLLKEPVPALIFLVFTVPAVTVPALIELKVPPAVVKVPIEPLLIDVANNDPTFKLLKEPDPAITSEVLNDVAIRSPILIYPVSFPI